MAKSTQQRPPRFGTKKADALLKKGRKGRCRFKKRYQEALLEIETLNECIRKLEEVVRQYKALWLPDSHTDDEGVA